MHVPEGLSISAQSGAKASWSYFAPGTSRARAVAAERMRQATIRHRLSGGDARRGARPGVDERANPGPPGSRQGSPGDYFEPRFPDQGSQAAD
jgi:hypothetical protein